MKPIEILSAPEQVARHLKAQIQMRTWTGIMPGGAALARELGIGRTTADSALDLLAAEGIVESQGARRRRQIVKADLSLDDKPISVGLLLYEPEDASNPHVFELRKQLFTTRFRMELAPKTLLELGHNPSRVDKMLRDHPYDAWVIHAGSEPVLRWCSELSIPAFALFGRMKDLKIPGVKPDKIPAMRDALRIVTGLGHRRMVLLVREERRSPSYGNFEKVFLEELAALGILTGNYNIPDWQETPSGLRSCLEKLLKITPPSVIFVGDAVLFIAIQNLLRQMNTKASNQVCLICTDHHPNFDWCDPPIPHFSWDHRATVRQIVNWLRQMSRGKPTYKQTFAPTKFVHGDLIRRVSG